MPVPGAAASVLPSALSALPTAAAVGVLCVAVVVEIVAVPAVLLPGGTMTLLAGALIGSGLRRLPLPSPSSPRSWAVTSSRTSAAPR